MQSQLRRMRAKAEDVGCTVYTKEAPNSRNLHTHLLFNVNDICTPPFQSQEQFRLVVSNTSANLTQPQPSSPSMYLNTTLCRWCVKYLWRITFTLVWFHAL
ncbi:hypothetical protein VTK56DRAFT_8947 [Thermocarpiscus australiensis]